MDDLGAGCLAIFLGIIGLFVVGVVGFVSADYLFYGLRLEARRAEFECSARNLKPVRMDFSTRVACQSRNTGADSLTVKTVQ